jgi:hypothetical protein
MCCLSKSFQVRGIAIPKAAEIEVESGLRQKRRKYLTSFWETDIPPIVCSCVSSSSGQYFMPVDDAPRPKSINHGCVKHIVQGS